MILALHSRGVCSQINEKKSLKIVIKMLAVFEVWQQRTGWMEDVWCLIKADEMC